MVLTMCSWKWVVKFSARLVEYIEKHPYLAIPIYWGINATFMKQFVAGRKKEECVPALLALEAQGIGCILDYSVEVNDGSEEQLDAVADEICATVDLGKCVTWFWSRNYNDLLNKSLSTTTPQHAIEEATYR